MPAISATAPGKIILFGEHAVVYGRPAIAIPLQQVFAKVIVMAEPRLPMGVIRIKAPDIHLAADLSDLPVEHPLAIAITGTLAALSIANPPAMTLRITSHIPQAAGLGSGAAVSVALIKAVTAFLGRSMGDEQVSILAYEVEKYYHGTPSGIDNTVISFNKPVYFVKDRLIETFQIATPFQLVVGDTGVISPTSTAVGDLRTRWQVNPGYYEAVFDEIGRISEGARKLIEIGAPQQIGKLMDENHALLQKLGVSSTELDRLVEAARSAGALGAKLSGGGRGGNMIALVDKDSVENVAEALRIHGAVQTLKSVVR